MLIVRDARIEVGPRVLLEGASFSLQPGDKVGLVGRNGTGKTTLIRTLVGYQSPAAGSVLRSGNLGYFSQEAALPELEHPDATALERILAAREIGALNAGSKMLAARSNALKATGAIGRSATMQGCRNSSNHAVVSRQRLKPSAPPPPWESATMS